MEYDWNLIGNEAVPDWAKAAKGRWDELSSTSEGPDDAGECDIGTMSLSNIRNFVLGENPATRKTLGRIDAYLRSEIEASERGTERRLALLFYSLVTKIRLLPVETPEVRKHFLSFKEEIELQLHAVTMVPTMRTFFRDLGKDGPLQQFVKLVRSVRYRFRILENRVKVGQIRTFLFLCEYYVHHLERTYRDLSMSERVLELYVIRMDIKKIQFFFDRKFGAWFGFVFFRSISAYGTSFGRLTVTCALSVVLFGSVYWLADFFAPAHLRMIPSLTDYSSYVFNSLVTITGLGIDASPQTALQRFAMGVNTIYGMVVFGMLFNVISTKLSVNN